ncbi:NUDIX hydrolase [Patescibacteria group bacterium]|nr:NUDIX hydrolase [Patescibacteria group bacterium]MBU1931256.1 NUDIX hydrolase [Patescibacteria group bacterium]
MVRKRVVVQQIHVIVSAVLLDRQKRVLLVREAANKPYSQAKNRWSFPGGWLEPGETLWQTFQRELLEETGHQAQIAGLAKIYYWVNQDNSVVFVYVFLAKNPKKVTDKLAKDILETKWFIQNEVLALFAQKKMRPDLRDLQAYKNALAGKVVPLEIFGKC